MTEVPKIVYDRLRAALPKRALPEQTGPERAHPDADVLTAFAEQALSASEREGVLEHLALCGDCRELIALALPAADIVAAPIADEAEADRATPIPTKAERGWLTSHRFAWPTLRWTALAVGVAVVAAVLLVHPGKLNQVVPPSANQPATPVPAASGPQIASSPAASTPAASLPAASSSDATPSTNQLAVLAKAEEPPPTPELRSSKKLKAGQAVAPSLQAESGMLLVENGITDNKNNSKKEVDKVSAAPSGGDRMLDYNASAIPRSSEAVEVTTESQMVETEVSSEDRVVAQNNAPPVIKAKPAPQTGTSQQQNTVSAAVGELPLQARNVMSAAKLAPSVGPALARNVTWAITAGILQRSLDSGQSWQTALHADRPLLCYTSHDEDVWTGGQAGILFHSATGGVTWEQVRPSVKAQPLTSDITHIDVRSPAEIVISTSNSEIWSSANGGRTWEKK